MISDDEPVARGPVLRGRSGERAELRRLLDEARRGPSAALVLLGEAGIGKSALLDELAEAAADCRVVRAVGIESEMELPFAALHQLCAPLLDAADRLPAPQRDALRITFGFQDGRPPDAFLLGLSVLTLLSEAAAGRPLVCVIDDAQWLDRASVQTLAFVARRLLNDSVLMLFAVREPAGDVVRPLRSLPALTVEGLAGPDARELLASVLRWPIDADAREAILAEARGNPLALVELPLTPAALAGGFALPAALSDPDAGGAQQHGEALPGRIEGRFRQRVEALPGDARLLMLLAAAHPAGDSIVLWRAAGRLGLGGGAARAVESSGLLTIGVRAVFRHPLVRSAVYGGASPEERRRVHEALAESTDAATDPDRRAWHRAHAAEGPDESVAAELAASAGRAQARGGLAAAGAFLRRAAELTEGPARRADRELTAAVALYQGGSPAAAQRLLAQADAGPPDELRSIRIGLLRGQMAFVTARSGDAPAMPLDAARRLETLDPARARQTYLDAFAAAILVGRFGDTLPQIAAAARQAPAAVEPRGPDLLLDALAVLFTEGYAAGIPLVRAALDRIRRDELTLDEAMHWLFLIGHFTFTVWDEQLREELITRYLRLVREAGALAALSGDLPAARRALERLSERARPSGTDWALGIEACSRALVGDDAEEHFREAVVRLSRCRASYSLARTNLLYGEWLARRGRAADAVVQLRQAYEMMVSFGGAAFAQRAQRALSSLGDVVRTPALGALPELTAQERQIARRARDGLSNTQIGAELFLSSRTVEWHLRKVFTKLGVSSRRDLVGVLPSAQA